MEVYPGHKLSSYRYNEAVLSRVVDRLRVDVKAVSSYSRLPFLLSQPVRAARRSHQAYLVFYGSTPG